MLNTCSEYHRHLWVCRVKSICNWVLGFTLGIYLISVHSLPKSARTFAVGCAEVNADIGLLKFQAKQHSLHLLGLQRSRQTTDVYRCRYFCLTMCAV